MNDPEKPLTRSEVAQTHEPTRALRVITAHRFSEADKQIALAAVDGEHTEYTIDLGDGASGTTLAFRTVDTHGITNETLLAVVIDRIEGFQAGPLASGFNENALHHLRAALNSLHQRSLDRISRGVEGTL